MLDSFLEKDRRTLFFSRMRFSHQLTTVVFLFAVGIVFAAVFLLMVPAIFPKGEYLYGAH